MYWRHLWVRALTYWQVERLICILDTSMATKNQVGILWGRADQDSCIAHAGTWVGRRVHIRWREPLTGGCLLENSSIVTTHSLTRYVNSVQMYYNSSV